VFTESIHDLLREARVQEVWATRLTLGLVKSKLDEHGLLRSTELREADPEGEPVQLGPFTAEFIRVAHSIPDAVAIVLDTPGGRILHTVVPATRRMSATDARQVATNVRQR